MTFREELDREWRDQAEQNASRAAAAAGEAEAALRTARDAAALRLRDLHEAVEVLRANQERTSSDLMSRPDPFSRYSGSIGAIRASAREVRTVGKWFPRQISVERDVFGGWWVHPRTSENIPFELEVPLAGHPSIGGNTLEQFAATPFHTYSRDRGSGRETLQVDASYVFQGFLREIKRYLLAFGPPSAPPVKAPSTAGPALIPACPTCGGTVIRSLGDGRYECQNGGACDGLNFTPAA